MKGINKNILDGKKMNADGDTASVASTYKPVMPATPSNAKLLAARDIQQSLITSLASIKDQWSKAAAVSDYPSMTNLALKISSAKTKLDAANAEVKRLQDIYNQDYQTYSNELDNYNKQYAAWAQSTASLNNSDPKVIAAQIAAEQQKTADALALVKAQNDAAQSALTSKALTDQSSASASAANMKTYLIIGGGIAVVIIVAVVIIMIRKKKSA
jgi:hypothetical protein